MVITHWDKTYESCTTSSLEEMYSQVSMQEKFPNIRDLMLHNSFTTL